MLVDQVAAMDIHLLVVEFVDFDFVNDYEFSPEYRSIMSRVSSRWFEA